MSSSWRSRSCRRAPTGAGFAGRFHERFGYWPTTDRPTRPADVATLKREVLAGFFDEVRPAVLAADPAVAVGINVQTLYPGATSLASRGIDLEVLRTGPLDVYVPQLYHDTLAELEAGLADAEAVVGSRLSLFAGVSTRLGAENLNPAYVAQLGRA